MEKYIATKPVRFDRDYVKDEEIPASVIDIRMVKRLIEAGKIAVVTIPDGDEPQKNPSDSYLEQSVAVIESILGIDYGETMPDLDTRIESCKAGIEEIRQAVEKLNSEGDGELDSEKKPYEGDGVQLSINTLENAGDINIQADLETSLDTLQNDTEAVNNALTFTCAVCKKVCGSKSALTTHMKTHEKNS